MQIEMWDIDRIREYQGNPRLNDDAVDRVAESIRQFGFKVPVLVDQDGVLIAGHTRIRAARRLGMKQVPVIRADDLTPEQVRALRIADNKLHELSSWDMQLLPIELEALQAMNFDLDILGFSGRRTGRDSRSRRSRRADRSGRSPRAARRTGDQTRRSVDSR